MQLLSNSFRPVFFPYRDTMVVHRAVASVRWVLLFSVGTMPIFPTLETPYRWQK